MEKQPARIRGKRLSLNVTGPKWLYGLGVGGAYTGEKKETLFVGNRNQRPKYIKK